MLNMHAAMISGEKATKQVLYASEFMLKSHALRRRKASNFCFAMEPQQTSKSSSLALKQNSCRNPVLACRAASENNEASYGKDNSNIYGVSEMVVGVLGGGQLAQMLCQVASQMAIKVAILDPQENCPASSICHHHMVGSFDDTAAIQKFAKSCDVLTVETEHVDVATLEKLEQQGVDCQPKASTIRIIQDKHLQKVHFSAHGIPLPEFMEIDDLDDAKKAGHCFGYPLMIKSKRLAYDGRRNAVANSDDELSSAITALGGFEHGLYVEKLAPFVKELAVNVVRGKKGSIRWYPVFEIIHKENICQMVKAPANISPKLQKLATDVASRAVSSLEGAGVFAVELFLTKDGQVLLNEVAPGPHNSGHFTIEACFTSLFGQHLRAVTGLPLGEPSMKIPAAIMYNILVEDEGFYAAVKLMERALHTPQATVHWYCKPEIRKQRKLGHVTIVGSSMAVVEAHINFMLKGENLNQPPDIPLVSIIMGSDSDLPVMKDAAVILNKFGVPYEVRIVSAHRTPDFMYSYARSAKERGIQVIIAGAGGAAHLAGNVATIAGTHQDLVAVPISTKTLDGLDSVLSTLQMPRGVPVATVAIDDALGAGLLAIRSLCKRDPELEARLIQYEEDTRDDVLAKDEKLQKDGWKSYLESLAQSKKKSS